MDLLNDTFFVDTPTTSPLPEEDYRQNGKLKNVREYENGSFNLNTTKEIFNLDKEVREKAQGYIK